MSLMADNIEKLQQQLTTDCEVCCSHGMLDKFPNALRVSFLVEHVGIIVCHRGKFTIVAGGDTFKVEHGRTIFLNRGEYFHVVDSSADCLYSLLFYRIDTIRDILGNTVMGTKGYEVGFFDMGGIYYQDINVQMEKKMTKSFKLNLLYMNLSLIHI